MITTATPNRELGDFGRHLPMITKIKHSMPRFCLSIFASIIGAALAGCDQQPTPQQQQDAAVERTIDAIQAVRNEQMLKAVKAQQVFSGMSQSEVLRSLGQPKARERVTNPPELRERVETVWQYPSDNFVYFDYDGKAALISDGLQFKP